MSTISVLNICPGLTHDHDKSLVKPSNSSTLIIALVVVICFLLVTGLVIGIFLLKYRKRRTVMQVHTRGNAIHSFFCRFSEITALGNLGFQHSFNASHVNIFLTQLLPPRHQNWRISPKPRNRDINTRYNIQTMFLHRLGLGKNIDASIRPVPNPQSLSWESESTVF